MVRQSGGDLVAGEGHRVDRGDPEHATAMAGGISEEGDGQGEEFTEETVLEGNTWSDWMGRDAYLCMAGGGADLGGLWGVELCSGSLGVFWLAHVCSAFLSACSALFSWSHGAGPYNSCWTRVGCVRKLK